MHYDCRVVSGNGSATGYLTPMLQAWAAHRGIHLEPGTFNLPPDRVRDDCTRPAPHESLTSFDRHAPQFQQRRVGFAPRLYAVVVNGSVPGWLFRWSEPANLTNFVGAQPGVCEQPSRFCEIVTESRLRDVLKVNDGDVVRLTFGETSAARGAVATLAEP